MFDFSEENKENMKIPFVLFAFAVSLSSCYFGKDMQVERVNVELVKVDTVYRSGATLKVLTWKTDNRLEYFSMEPLDAPQMDVGSTTVMLIKK